MWNIKKRQKPVVKAVSGRKAQFYIFTAILLCGFALGILIPISAISAPSKAFKDINSNYVYEAHRAINSALFENDNITERLEYFSDDFLGYASKKDKGFGLVYMLADDDIYVGNHLAENINITADGSVIPVAKGEVLMINMTDSIYLTSAKDRYRFDFNGSGLRLKVFFKTVKGDDVRVFVEDG